MRETVFPELAAESVETAERLGRLSAEEGLNSAETEYIILSGLAAIVRVPKLWQIIRSRIGDGITGAKAQEFLAQLLDAVDRNLSLAGTLKEQAGVANLEPGSDTNSADELARAEEQLLEVRAEAVRLLHVVDVPARWPSEEQLRDARERMRNGDRLTAEEFRQALLDQ
jgi:hypothetical protein